MELYIYNANRALSGVIEAYEYLRWTRRYSRCGSFELKAVATDENLALLRIGNILWKNDDEEAGLIEFMELTGSEHELILISGRFATGFLHRRIIWGTETLSGDISAAIGQLLNRHMLNPARPERKIGGILYSPVTMGVSVSTQMSHRNLMEAVSGLCDSVDVGIKTLFNPESGMFNIVLYKGTVSQAVFSRESENIIDQVFTQSAAEFACFALVGGEGEGADRQFVTVGGGEDENRYEIFVDAKDLQSEDFPTDYTDALLFRGQQKLTEQAMVQAFDVTINSFGNLTYKTDFDIGSLVQAVSKRWNISMSARITEVEESYDREGFSLNVTFGKPLLTLAEKLSADMSAMQAAVQAPFGGMSEIPDGSVTTVKLADGAVTTAKMAQEANIGITISWASGVSLAGSSTQNSFINKGVVCIGFQINVTSAVAIGGTVCTITNPSFRPYATVRSVFHPVPASGTPLPMTISASGVIANASTGSVLPVGYYIISVTYARA
jgi:hypothetical protein